MFPVIVSLRNDDGYLKPGMNGEVSMLIEQRNKVVAVAQTGNTVTLEVDTEDGKYSVEFAECLACCGFGPVLMVDDDFYEKVDAAKAAEVLAKYN